MPSKADLVAAYRSVTMAQRQRVAAMVGGVWLDMDSWSDASAERMLSKVVPLVEGGQAATAQTTAAYLQAMTGVKVGKLDLSQVTGAAVRNGVSQIEVYMRAVVKGRAVYSRSDLVELAVNEGFAQLMGSVGVDMQLAANHTARQVMGRVGIDVYRRATRAGACSLCIEASDNVYSSGDLLPLHTHCHCVVVPGDRLPRSLQRPSNASKVDGRGLRIDDNDEIGPVLDYASHAGRTVRPVGTATTAATITPAQRLDMKRAQLKSYEDVIAGGGGTDWMRTKVSSLRDEVAAMAAASDAV